MRTDRYKHQLHCLACVAQLQDMLPPGSPGVGVGEIMRYTQLSRPTVHAIMKQAVAHGYATMNETVWRSNDGRGNPVMAYRYGVTSFWNRTYRKHAVSLIAGGKI
jgi:hypothetical protein